MRTSLVIVVWLTVAGGALMAMLWIAFGGERAVGPEDEMMARAGVRKDDKAGRRFTSFSSAQVGMHGLLGILTASLITYAAVRSDDRATGYVAGLVAIAITAVPGTMMFLKWKSRQRPVVAGTTASARGSRVEDRLPTPVVLGHGAAAAAVVVLLLVLIFVD